MTKISPLWRWIMALYALGAVAILLAVVLTEPTPPLWLGYFVLSLVFGSLAALAGVLIWVYGKAIAWTLGILAAIAAFCFIPQVTYLVCLTAFVVSACGLMSALSRS